MSYNWNILNFKSICILKKHFWYSLDRQKINAIFDFFNKNVVLPLEYPILGDVLFKLQMSVQKQEADILITQL